MDTFAAHTCLVGNGCLVLAAQVVHSETGNTNSETETDRQTNAHRHCSKPPPHYVGVEAYKTMRLSSDKFLQYVCGAVVS